MSVRLYECMYVCLYICLYVRFRGKRDFLGPYIRQSSHFLCAHFSCIIACIQQILYPSVCRSGYKRQKSFATYGFCHPCFSYYSEGVLLALVRVEHLLNKITKRSTVDNQSIQGINKNDNFHKLFCLFQPDRRTYGQNIYRIDAHI